MSFARNFTLHINQQDKDEYEYVALYNKFVTPVYSIMNWRHVNSRDHLRRARPPNIRLKHNKHPLPTFFGPCAPLKRFLRDLRLFWIFVVASFFSER